MSQYTMAHTDIVYIVHTDIDAYTPADGSYPCADQAYILCYNNQICIIYYTVAMF